MPSRLRPFPARTLYGASPVWWFPDTKDIVSADFFESATAAPVEYTYSTITAAPLELKDAAAHCRTRARSGVGALSVGGSSVRCRVRARSGVGAVVSGGAVSRVRTIVRAGTGATAAAGLSARLKVLTRSATGAMSVTGTKTVSRAMAASGSSASSVLGSSSVSRTRSPSTLGSLTFALTSAHSRTRSRGNSFPITASGSYVSEYIVADTTVYTEWMSYDSDHVWLNVPLDPQWSALLDVGYVRYTSVGVGALLSSGLSSRCRTRAKSSTAALVSSGSSARVRTRCVTGLASVGVGGSAVTGFSAHRSYAGAGSVVATGSCVYQGPNKPFVHAATFWISISGATTWCRAQYVSSTAAMSMSGSQGYAFKICVRQVSSFAFCSFAGQAAVARSRIRTYAGTASLSASGSASRVRTRIYNAKLTTVVTGGVAVSIKLDGHYYGGTATILSGGLTPRCRTRVRALGGGATFGGGASSAFTPVVIRSRAGTAALLAGGGYARQLTVARVGTAALVLAGSGLSARLRGAQGQGALALGGAASVCRAHTAAGVGLATLAGAHAVQRTRAVDGRANFALSMTGRLGLGVPLRAVHVGAHVHSVRVAFGEVLEFILLNAPICVSEVMLSRLSFGIATSSPLAARVVTVESSLVQFVPLHVSVCQQSDVDSCISRVLTFDSLSLQ